MRLAIYADLLYAREDDRITTQTAFVSWLGELSDHFDEVVVLGRADPTPKRFDHELTGKAVRFVELPFYPNLRALGAVSVAAARAVRVFQRNLRQCDVVLLFGPHPYAVLFGLEATVARVPVVVGVRQDFHRYVAFRCRGWERPFALSAAVVLEAAHKSLARRGGAVAVGEEMARRYRESGAQVLETGVSLVRAADVLAAEDSVRPWPGELRALSAGRLDREKNPLLLLDIAEALRKDAPWRLVVAGSGSLHDELATAIKSRGLEDAVVLRGRLSSAELRAEYEKASVLIHVSLTEGQPQVLYEAAAAGLPIVATAVGGVPAALRHGERGLLVPPSDAEAVRAAVRRLEVDPLLRVSMIRAAAEWAREESIEAQCARAAEFLTGLVSARASRSRGGGRRGRSSTRC